MNKRELEKTFYSLCYQDIVDQATSTDVELSDDDLRQIGDDYNDDLWSDTIFELINELVRQRRQ